MKLGIAYIETDCHPTRDGAIVLRHDETVDDTTDGSGRIADLALPELLELDAGHRFTPDGKSFPHRGKGVRIPLLAQALERFPQTRFNIEIKAGSRSVVEDVIQIVERAGANERVLLAAADDQVMAHIHAASPRTAIGSSRADVLAFYESVLEKRWRSHQPRGQALQVPPEFEGQRLVTPEVVEAAHEVGLHVHVWTVNEPEEMRRLLALGVDGLMSDYPARLIEVAQSLAR